MWRPLPSSRRSPRITTGLLSEAASAECARSVEALRAETGGRRIVLRVDRVELSKNIVRGMLAFEELLLAYPQWRDEVVHVALVYPSRQGLADYLAYGAEVTHTAERINHAWGTATWTPVVLHMEDDRPRSLASLTIFDVLLVNPVRDGLNLVAKEGSLLNGGEGVLVLSHEAGAWEELSEAALGVNPFDVAGTADALHRALSMDPVERRSRAERLRSQVLGRTAADWLEDQLAARGAASQSLTAAARASCSNSATAPAGPSTTRSDCAATLVIAFRVDHGDPRHRPPPVRPALPRLRMPEDRRGRRRIPPPPACPPPARGRPCPCPRRAEA